MLNTKINFIYFLTHPLFLIIKCLLLQPFILIFRFKALSIYLFFILSYHATFFLAHFEFVETRTTLIFKRLIRMLLERKGGKLFFNHL